MLGTTDALVYAMAISSDFVMVTANREDFLALARAEEVHPGLILMSADRSSDQVRALHAALDLIDREAATAGEAPRDWLVNRGVFAPSEAMCAFGATDEDPPTS